VPQDADASSLPSCENATAWTTPEWPSSVCSGAPVAGSHSQLLVKRNNVEADSKDRYSRTPLSRAAANGHEAVVKLLVERADVEADSKDSYDETPLLGAAERGHKAVVQLLRTDAAVVGRGVWARGVMPRFQTSSD
jgi:hypothetical protein